MTTKELIKMLKKIDPKGNHKVIIDARAIGIDIPAAATLQEPNSENHFPETFVVLNMR